MLSFLRSSLISLVIAVILFAGIETVVRFGFPQTLTTTYLSEDTLGLKDELVGHTNRPNVHAKVVGPEYDVEYVVNEQGYRDARIYGPEKPDGVKRILLLGDSFTFGTGNDYADIWPVLLENKLQQEGHQIEVIKAGVPGYDTRREVLYMEQLYAELRPDIVIFVFLPNDLFTNTPIAELSDDAAEKRDDGLRFKDDKKSEFHSVTLIKRMLMSNDSLYENLYLMTGRRAYYSTDPNAEVLKQYEETEKLFSRANSSCKEWGCEFVVISLPQQYQVLAAAHDSSREGIDPEFIDSRLAAFAEREGFQWISVLPDLARIYRETNTDLYFRLDGHLNGAGNKSVAEIIGNAMSDTLSQRHAISEPVSD